MKCPLLIQSFYSFADLYERAVRNVLNIRPLFDTPLDIFEQRRPSGHNQPLHPQQQQHHTGRKTRPENGLQQEPAVKDDPERKSSEARIPRPEYPHGGHNESASRFFTHVLSEQIRHSHPRSYASPSQMPRYTGDEHKIHTQSNLPTSSQTTQNRNNVFYDRAHDGYRRYWSQQTGHNYKHKPGMLDSMKHPPRHQIEFQTHENTSDVKEPIKQEIRTEKEDQSEAEIKSDSNELSKNIDYKPLTDAELENYKDKVRENARLKYRPYSLRSKKNGMRKKFTSDKRKGNKNKKQMKIRNSWKPQSSQEMFLFNLGLMRKIKTENVKNANLGNGGGMVKSDT